MSPSTISLYNTVRLTFNLEKVSQVDLQSFKNEQLLKQAFTHTSYANEHRKSQIKDNERLEFLGDAVLELAVSQYLYRGYPLMSEGELTKLRANIVCEPSLHKFSVQLGMDQLVYIGKGEEATGGRSRPALLADVFEAFIGALYLDQNFDATLNFLKSNVFPRIEVGAFSHAMDYKSSLQEFVQKQGQQVSYQIVNEIGPDHDRQFVAACFIEDRHCGEGKGRSKKEAEQRAAERCLTALKQPEQ